MRPLIASSQMFSLSRKSTKQRRRRCRAQVVTTGHRRMARMDFIKGHGTENDFIVIVDPEVQVPLSVSAITELSDRRAGIGADGVIRIATAGSLVAAGVLEDLPEGVQADEWFMDYRNADGSIAEMCGNGVRVFAHVLAVEGLISAAPGADAAAFGIGTRGGRKLVTVHRWDETSADVSVDMGAPRIGTTSEATFGESEFHVRGLAVDMGNPHLAAIVPDLTEEALREAPIDRVVSWDPEVFPEGVNVEVATPLHDGAITMRVHERGVGETRSCGTGTVAAAVAALASQERQTGHVQVRVPGGQVEVTITADTSILRGPARIVARGTTVSAAQ